MTVTYVKKTTPATLVVTLFIDYTWSHTATSVHAMRMSLEWEVGFRDHEPRTAMMADLNSANNSLHRIQQSTWEYGSCFFTLRRSANLLKKVVHSRAIPPVDENISGVYMPLSTSLTLLSIFPFLCSFMGSVQCYKFLVLIWGGSRVKNVCQRRPVETCSLRLSLATPSQLAVLSGRVSPSRVCSLGSISTFVHTSFIISAVMSRTSLWRKVGRPPLWQDMAWSTSKVAQHAHLELTLVIFHPYLRHRASLKALLLRERVLSFQYNLSWSPDT